MYFMSLLVALPAGAGLRQYAPDLDEAGWQAEGTPLRCVLRQDIPLYGRAEFVHRAGEQVALRLKLLRPARTQRVARLESRPPAWKHGLTPRPLGEARLETGPVAVRLERDRALRLIAELESGMQPAFCFDDLADGQDRVEVVLSPVRFHEALARFQQCAGKLFPYNYRQIRRSLVHFEVNEYYLDDKAKQRLNAIARYLKLDPKVREIQIFGHADAAGNRFKNLSLSEHRAAAVRDYLISLGVPRKKIKMRYFGDRKPIASNRTVEGRARNRRVEVRLKKPF